MENWETGVVFGLVTFGAMLALQECDTGIKKSTFREGLMEVLADFVSLDFSDVLGHSYTVTAAMSSLGESCTFDSIYWTQATVPRHRFVHTLSTNPGILSIAYG